MDGRTWLDDILTLYRRYQSDFEKASAQVSDEELFALVGGIPHSMAGADEARGREPPIALA